MATSNGRPRTKSDITSSSPSSHFQEAVFDYNAGYFEVCREFVKREGNESYPINLEDIASEIIIFSCIIIIIESVSISPMCNEAMQ